MSGIGDYREPRLTEDDIQNMDFDLSKMSRKKLGKYTQMAVYGNSFGNDDYDLALEVLTRGDKSNYGVFSPTHPDLEQFIALLRADNEKDRLLTEDELITYENFGGVNEGRGLTLNDLGTVISAYISENQSSLFGRRRKRRSPKGKNKVYFGSRGGRYIKKKGKKVYI